MATVLPMPRDRRRPTSAAGVVAVLVAALAVTACGSSGGEGAPTAAASAAAKDPLKTGQAPTSTPTTEPAASAEPSAEPATQGAADPATPQPTAYPDDPSAPACTGTDLTVRVTWFDAALGSRFLGLEATNTSGHACAVQGAPVLAFQRLSGTATPGVDSPALCAGAAPRVVVPDGQRVFSGLEWLAMSTANDPDVSVELRVRAVPDGARTVLPFDEVALPDGTTLDQLDVLDGAEVEVAWWQASDHVFDGCPAA